VCRTVVAIGSYEGPSKNSESVEARYCASAYKKFTYLAVSESTERFQLVIS